MLLSGRRSAILWPGQNQLGNFQLRNWVLGSVTTVMGVAALFVSSRAGYGVAYYGGLLFFLFAVLFVILLIKASYDEVKEATALSEFRELAGKVTGFLKPATTSADPGPPVVHTIGTADLRDALARGFADFMVRPTHLIILPQFVYHAHPIQSLLRQAINRFVPSLRSHHCEGSSAVAEFLVFDAVWLLGFGA